MYWFCCCRWRDSNLTTIFCNVLFYSDAQLWLQKSNWILINIFMAENIATLWINRFNFLDNEKCLPTYSFLSEKENETTQSSCCRPFKFSCMKPLPYSAHSAEHLQRNAHIKHHLCQSSEVQARWFVACCLLENLYANNTASKQAQGLQLDYIFWIYLYWTYLRMY